MRNRLCIILCALCISWGVKAHQPDLSTNLLVEQEDSEWVLQIRSALTAFEYAIHLQYGADAYDTPEAFRQLVIKHLQDNITIQLNEDNIKLQKGIVKLGHETSVAFTLTGVPENLHTVKFTNSSFKDISRNQGALIIFKKGFKQKQLVLNNKNQHMVYLEADGQQFNTLTYGPNKASVMPISLRIGLMGILGTLALVIFGKKSKLWFDLNRDGPSQTVTEVNLKN